MRKQRRRWLRNGFGGLFVAGCFAASPTGLAQAERDGFSEFFHSEAVDSIEVLVEDARSRGKVDGARLTFQWIDVWGKKGNRQVVTAKDGRGLLDLAGQRVRGIACRVECSGYLTVETRWSAGQLGGERQGEGTAVKSRVRLVRPTRTLSGKVVDYEGKGIEGVAVLWDYCYNRSYGSSRGKYLDFNGFSETVKAVTDSEGRWSLKGVLPGQGSIRTSSRFRYQHADYPDHGDPSDKERFLRNFRRSSTGAFLSGRETTHLLAEGLATMPMGKGFHYNGQLLDAENRPIVGGRIGLYAPRIYSGEFELSGWGLRRVASARTDLDGRFRFEEVVVPIPPLEHSELMDLLARYQLVLIASGEGMKPTRHLFSYVKAHAPAPIVLESGFVFHGKIENASGDPMPNVAVRLTEWNGVNANLLRRGAISGSDGRFEWSSSPVGELELSFDWLEGLDKAFEIIWDPAGLSRTVEKPRKRFSAERAVQVDAPKEHVFVLNKPIRIQGTAVNGLTDEPLAELEARVLSAYSSDEEELARVQGSNGIFEAEFLLSDEGFSFVVEIQAEGFQTTRSKSQSIRDLDEKLKIALFPASIIEGKVIKPDGQPAANAKVLRVPWMWDGEEDFPNSGPLFAVFRGNKESTNLGLKESVDWGFRAKEYYQTNADSEGRFKLGDKALDIPFASFADPGALLGDEPPHPSLSNPAVSHKDDFLVALSPAGFAAVSVKEVLKSGTIRLQPLSQLLLKTVEFGRPMRHRAVRLSMQSKSRGPGLKFYFTTATNAEGEAQFKNLPAGNYELHVVPDSNVGTYTFPVDTNRVDRRGEVALSPGETKQMQIGGQGIGVRGRLTAPNAEFEIDWTRGVVDNGIDPRHPMRVAGLVYLGTAENAENSNEKRETDSRRPIIPDADGFFGVDALEPGRYQLQYSIIRPEARGTLYPFPNRQRNLPPELARMNHFMRMPKETILKNFFRKDGITALVMGGRLVGYVDREILIPPPSNSENPNDASVAKAGVFDLGEIPISLGANLKVGDTAPAFTTLPDSGETPIHSRSLLGKRVVLCFAITSGTIMHGPNHFFIRDLGSAFQKNLKNRKDLVFLSLVLADSFPKTRTGQQQQRYRNEEDIWQEALVGEWETSQAAKAFGVIHLPAIFVISPEGVLEGVNLNHVQTYELLVRSSE